MHSTHEQNPIENKITFRPKGSEKKILPILFKDSFLFALILFMLILSYGLVAEINRVSQRQNKQKREKTILGSIEKSKHKSKVNSHEKGDNLVDFLSLFMQSNQKKSQKLFQRLCRGQARSIEIKQLTMNDFFLASHALSPKKKNQVENNAEIMLNNQWFEKWDSCRSGLRKIFIAVTDNQIKKEIIYWMWQKEPVWAHGFFYSQMNKKNHDTEIQAILALAEKGTRMYPFAVRLRKEKNLMAQIKPNEFFHHNGRRYPTAIHLLRYDAVPVLLEALKNPSSEIRLYAMNALPYLKTDYNQKEVLRKTASFLNSKKFSEKEALQALRAFYER